MMQTLVIYDIPSTKIRNKVAEACLDYGLDRIQWSAFLGDMNHNRREELEARLRKVLGRRAGNIQFFPLCDRDLRQRVIIEITKEEEKKESESSRSGRNDGRRQARCARARPVKCIKGKGVKRVKAHA